MAMKAHVARAANNAWPVRPSIKLSYFYTTGFHSVDHLPCHKIIQIDNTKIIIINHLFFIVFDCRNLCAYPKYFRSERITVFAAIE